jgi:acyl-CoA synthetase (NDP forming)
LAGVEASNIRRLLKPRSVAVVGASEDPRTMGGNVLVNLKRAGFSGPLHLVSRRRSEIDGQPCVKSIDDLPEGVDSVVLIIPQEAVIESIEACARRKVGGAIVFASGFAEAGPEGKALQERLSAVARQGGVALNGPNNLGLINYVQGVPLTFGEYQPMRQGKGAGIGIVAQSGAIGSCIRDSLVANGIGVTYFISTGNEAVLTAEDFLEEVLDDGATGAVLLFLEQIRQPQKLLALARKARAAGKPIVLMQPGRTEKAQQAAQSHTGAFTGDLAVMRAVLGHEGVVVVDGLDALVDVGVLLASRPIPEIPGTAVMTNSGAMRGISFDVAGEAGLELIEWSPETATKLREIFPPFVPIDNPLDTGTFAFGRPEIWDQAARPLLDDPRVGALIVTLFPGRPPQQVEKAEYLLPAIRASKKPVAFVMLGDPMQLDEKFMTLVREDGVPLYRSTERAIRAVAAVTRLAKTFRGTRAATLPVQAPAVRGLPKGTVAEYRSKEILSRAGIPLPKGRLAANVNDAEKIAAEIGYPVVLKAQAAALAHKSDAGGVLVNIADAAALRAGWEQMHANVRRAKPGLALDGILVEAMAPRGLEMIVGARRDPNWGPVLMLGLGGIWVETLKDVQLLPTGVDEAAIVEALGRLRGAQLLRGARGAEPVDVTAVAGVARRIAMLIEQSPEISEIEINPLIAYPEGKGVLALDALIVTG